MRRNFIVIAIFVALLAGAACGTKNNKHLISNKMKTNIIDTHSYAQPDEAVVKHLDLNLSVDFEHRQLSGTALLSLQKAPGTDKVILDTKDLHIEKVLLGNGDVARYETGRQGEILGTEMIVYLPKGEDKISIQYTTSPGAEALQWLTAAQTADKKAPFLFTQSEAILARSWIPLQDSPGIRFTYDATVEVPKGMMALMSAENPQQVNAEGTYHFTMKKPIPSYLMALAVGVLDFASEGDKTGVYAEPGVLPTARAEFSEMEDMLTIAEKLYGKYRWGRYDLIVLPPSFPFGGMENPCLTFATPTILAGDKSLTSLVAHELAHSWSGNLVTNATWNDFWLNEGFTVYFENRIMEALKGKDYADMLAVLSRQELQEEVDAMMRDNQAQDTRLKLDLTGRNPDDGMTNIAYDKGFYFLKRLEFYAGREQFDEFLNGYFSSHAFQSNTTEAFVSYLKENLFEKNGLKPIDNLHEWIYGEGLPADMPEIKSVRFERVNEAIEDWKNGKKSMDTDGWSTHEWVHFIKQIADDITADSLAQLDKKFDFTHSGNAEILGVWFVHCAHHLYDPSFGPMRQFLVRTGRRKFLMPIYKALLASKEGKVLAKSIYQQARPNYHFVATNSLDPLLQ